MTNGNDLVFLAGSSAWERIRDAGLHPEDVAAEKNEVGAAIIIDQNAMEHFIDDGNQYLFVTGPVKHFSYYITTANAREKEINTFESFIKTIEKFTFENHEQEIDF